MTLAAHLTFAQEKARLRAQLAEREAELRDLRARYRIACAVIEEHALGEWFAAALASGRAVPVRPQRSPAPQPSAPSQRPAAPGERPPTHAVPAAVPGESGGLS